MRCRREESYRNRPIEKSGGNEQSLFRLCAVLKPRPKHIAEPKRYCSDRLAGQSFFRKLRDSIGKSTAGGDNLVDRLFG